MQGQRTPQSFAQQQGHTDLAAWLGAVRALSSPTHRACATAASAAALAAYIRSTEGITHAELKRALGAVFDDPVLAPPREFAAAARTVVREASK